MSSPRAQASRLRRIAILGSTGSIGQSALSVVDAHADRLSIVGLAAGENSDLLAEQIAKYRPKTVSMASGEAIDRLKETGPGGVAIAGHGRDGLVAVATAPDVDVVLCASSGTEALEAVLAAIAHRPRSHRGALAVRRSRRSDRRGRPPAVGRAFDGRVDGRIGHRAARRHRHAAADSVCVFLSGAMAGAAAGARPRPGRPSRLRR